MESLTKFLIGRDIDLAQNGLVAALYLLLLTLKLPESFPVLAFGGLVGFFFLPAVKKVLGEESEPLLDSILLQIPLAVLAFYAATALDSLFGLGFVLTIFLTTLLSEARLFFRQGHVDEWFRPVRGGVARRIQRVYFAVVVLVFLGATLLA